MSWLCCSIVLGVRETPKGKLAGDRKLKVEEKEIRVPR
jgi:hypothetical protein